MSNQILYINTIDECVSDIIDSCYVDIIKNKSFEKKLLSSDYVINNFNNILSTLQNIIQKNILEVKINELITNQDDYKNIILLFNDYLLLYLFFYLGSIISSQNNDTIINLLNKLNSKYKIDFFKNKYITQYTIYHKYIQDYITVINDIDNPNFKDEFKDIITSISELDESVIKSIISLPKNDQIHNIVKIVIFKQIYIKEDKTKIFKILENDELSNTEFKYIDIVDTKYESIDYSSIESLFNIAEIKSGIAEEIFQMLNEYEIKKYKKDFNTNDKINYLFEKKILIPITDEFLRYHKDMETYDNIPGQKDFSTKIDKNDRTNKKDNTKIRYIVTKINRIKDYYTPKVLVNKALQAEIEKNFYQPLIYRKCVIMNDIEEINILRKLELQGKHVTENNEFYEDLKNMRSYPYIEFKFTNRDSFSFTANKTIDAIRFCSIEYQKDPKFSNILNTEVQYRIINNNIKANIVGIAIPRYNLIDSLNTLIPCNKVKDLMDMSLLNKNSFLVTIKKLRKILTMPSKKYSKLLYWIFNKKNDKIKLNSFDNINELPSDEYIHVLLEKIYDEVVNITYELAVKEINEYETIDIITAKNIIKKLESKLVYIPKDSKEYSELMIFIYYVKSQTLDQKDTYDKNEDKVLGIDTKFIKLPKIILEKIAIHVIQISKAELITTLEDDSDMYEGYLCQHNVTWNNITRLKKRDPNKFNQLLFDFFKKYITENKENDFICKSCYQMVDLNKYTTEVYPGSDSVAITYGLETELETIADYVKYTKSIKNMDKMIEKICYGANITYFVGSAQQTKFRRQEVIKNIIDLVDVQYNTLYSKDTNNRKERFDKSVKKYGCSMSNFFLFKLENDIFTYSSKEVDKFKLFKINNVLTYMMISIILEISLSQILFLSFDKLVNYFLFTKFGFNLFDNLYIRISNKNDIAPIKNYKLLCYVIYYLSGIYAKFNMWHTEDVVFKPNNINPQIQRVIIHTFIDAINSILEVNTRENKNYIYNVFAIKFFNKLMSIYNNNTSKDIIDNLELINKKKVVITSDKKLKYNVSSVNSIKLIPYVSDGKYMMQSTFGVNTKIAPYPSLVRVKDKFKEKTRESLVGSSFESIIEKFKNESLIKIAILYDINGRRSTPLTIEEANKLSSKELKIIYDTVKNIRLKNMNYVTKKFDKKLEKLNIKNMDNEKYIDELKNKFNVEISEIVATFINKLESLIGKDNNINNKNYYLQYDVFEINHNYKGTKQDSIFITDKEQKIKFKKNDKYFKQDIYIYDDTINKVTIYYSAIEKYILGYKEINKDYKILHNTDCYIKIHYSVKKQLELLGFNYINNRIGNDIKNINEYINNILRIRLQNLKNSLSEIQQIIYQVKTMFKGSNINFIAKLYQTKIKSINTYDDNGDRIFKDWTIINNSLYYENINIEPNIQVLPNKSRFISSDILQKFITNDNIIIFYIVQQFNLLLDINTDNHIKINLAYMIINIIFQLFRNFTNSENAFYNINVKKFYYHIITKSELSDIIDEIDPTKMTEDELEKYKEQKYDDIERLDALDADQEPTNKDFGDEDTLLLDRQSGDY